MKKPGWDRHPFFLRPSIHELKVSLREYTMKVMIRPMTARPIPMVAYTEKLQIPRQTTDEAAQRMVAAFQFSAFLQNT